MLLAFLVGVKPPAPRVVRGSMSRGATSGHAAAARESVSLCVDQLLRSMRSQSYCCLFLQADPLRTRSGFALLCLTWLQAGATLALRRIYGPTRRFRIQAIFAISKGLLGSCPCQAPCPFLTLFLQHSHKADLPKVCPGTRELMARQEQRSVDTRHLCPSEPAGHGDLDTPH